MKYPIHNTNSELICEAEIYPSPGETETRKLGLAVEWASKNNVSLRGAALYGIDARALVLTGADLTDARMTDALFTGANMTRAIMTRAFMTDAVFTYANLTGADMTDATMPGVIGNMREVKSLQIGEWPITYTADTLQIGCQRHLISKWRRWNTEAGRKWIEQMGAFASSWAKNNLAAVLGIIDASPATPTGNEKEDA